MANEILETKLTNYDAFRSLESVLQDAEVRHTLEGAVILASPYILSMRGLRYNDFNDIRYKLQISTIIRDTLMSYAKNSDCLSKIPESKEDMIKGFLSPSMNFGYMNPRRHEFNLPGLVAKVFGVLGADKQVTMCKVLGEEAESRIKHLYNNRGYEPNINKRPKNVGRYLRAEYDFFTRVVAKIYRQMT